MQVYLCASSEVFQSSSFNGYFQATGAAIFTTASKPLLYFSSTAILVLLRKLRHQINVSVEYILKNYRLCSMKLRIRYSWQFGNSFAMSYTSDSSARKPIMLKHTYVFLLVVIHKVLSRSLNLFLIGKASCYTLFAIFDYSYSWNKRLCKTSWRLIEEIRT